VPTSWLLTFTEGSRDVTARCYLHGDGPLAQGWHLKSDRVIKLTKAFKMPGDTHPAPADA
jgi:hypothetical protein